MTLFIAANIVPGARAGICGASVKVGVVASPGGRTGLAAGRRHGMMRAMQDSRWERWAPWAGVAFALLVVLSLVATACFDPHALWDEPSPDESPADRQGRLPY